MPNKLTNKLYKLAPLDDVDLPTRYDIADGFVIAAKSPQAARKLAADNCGDEGPNVWLDPTTTSCRQVKTDVAGIVLRSYVAA